MVLRAVWQGVAAFVVFVAAVVVVVVTVMGAIVAVREAWEWMF